MAPTQSRDGVPADREAGRRGARYADGDRNDRRSRDEREVRDSKYDHKPRRHDGRSRSPARRDHGARDSPRQRSPPRNSRSGRTSPPRDRGEPSRNGIQPSSRAPNGTKSTSRRDMGNGSTTNGTAPDLDDAMDEDETLDPEEREVKRQEDLMRRAMGFAKFKSTKNTKVPGNDKNYAVSKRKPTEYRQYMNRVGGFNRPLSPSRE